MSTNFLITARLKNNHQKIVCGLHDTTNTPSKPTLLQQYCLLDGIKDFNYSVKFFDVHILISGANGETIHESNLKSYDKDDLVAQVDYFMSIV